MPAVGRGESLAEKNIPPRFNTVGEFMFATYDNPIMNEDGKAIALLMEKIPVCIIS